MKKQHDRTDEYYIYIFNKLLTIAPIIGLCAACVFTAGCALGLFASTDSISLIVFDMFCISYFFVAYVAKKFGIIKNGNVDSKSLLTIGIALDLILILQWNMISYIFPSRSLWGFAPMFVLISSFLFNLQITLYEIIGLSLSIAVSWIINDQLLPYADGNFTENYILRIVALVLSFSLIAILTYFSERFTLLAKQNFKTMSEKNDVLENMGRDIIDFTADLIEERDESSGSHVKRLRNYTLILATQLAQLYPEYNLTEDKIEQISLASVLHDVGKIAIPDNILLKPGKLTSEEFDIIKTHTSLGAKIIDKLPDSVGDEYKRYCKEICQYHHEKYDGKGYPIGLKGDDIPISAQIVSVVDCYDALISNRPYKKALPSEMAIKMIMEGECGLFSDKILNCLEICKNKIIST